MGATGRLFTIHSTIIQEYVRNIQYNGQIINAMQAELLLFEETHYIFVFHISRH